MNMCVCVCFGEGKQRRRRLDKEGGSKEVGGWTDGRGYAWLKGTRWEEADGGGGWVEVGLGGGGFCVRVRKPPYFTFPRAKLIVETPLRSSSLPSTLR